MCAINQRAGRTNAWCDECVGCDITSPGIDLCDLVGVRPHLTDPGDSRRHEEWQVPEVWRALRPVIEDVYMHVPQPRNQKLSSTIYDTKILVRENFACRLDLQDACPFDRYATIGKDDSVSCVDHCNVIHNQSLGIANDRDQDRDQHPCPDSHGAACIVEYHIESSIHCRLLRTKSISHLHQ